MSQHGSFVTAINCMDGRVQVPVIEWLKKEYKVDYVDMITEPGPNKILAENSDSSLIESIKKRVDISVNKHGSKTIAIIGHSDCAGNPTDKQTQLNHLSKAIKTVQSWGYKVNFTGLWVDENWAVQKTN
jgi:hypothetical protein